MRIFSCLVEVAPDGLNHPLDDDITGAYVTVFGLAKSLDTFADQLADEIQALDLKVVDWEDFVELKKEFQEGETLELISQLSEDNPLVFDQFVMFDDDRPLN